MTSNTDIAATREQALTLGLSKYASSTACQQGHTGPRYTLTSNCVECTKARVIAKRHRDRDRYRAARAANLEAAGQESR